MAKSHPNHMVASVSIEQGLKMREKLLREVIRFERALEELKLQDGPVDFSLAQTYKEMIHVRNKMLTQLSCVRR